MYYSGNSFGTVAEIFLADDDSDCSCFGFRPLNGQALGLELGTDEVSVAGPVEVQHLWTATRTAPAASAAAQCSARLTIVEDDLIVLALLAQLVPGA